ncbi:MAG: SUMF1/EgtB/PvdO family nonheme iron enzyme [Chlamydiota bacterium]|nr:SUMF1/EgtB/PvdO family nonheme iron enzyme [Chlamydiota bacterium]
MNKIIFSFVLLTASVLYGQGTTSKGCGIEFKDREGDVVLTTDGMQLVGKLKSIPKLHFPFGDISFDGDDIYMMINHPESNKMHYITMDGHNYIGTIPEKSLDIEALGHEKIDFSTITAILPKQATTPAYDKKEKLFTITLDSGDKLTGIIVNESVNLSDGFEKTNIETEKISKFSKNEGIFINKGRYVVKLFNSFVTDDHLDVVIPKSNTQLKFKWNNIASVHKFDPLTDEDTIDAIADALHPFYSDSEPGEFWVGAGKNRNTHKKNAVGIASEEICKADCSVSQDCSNNFIGVIRKKEAPVIARGETSSKPVKNTSSKVELEPKQLFASEQDFNIPAGVIFLEDLDYSSSMIASADEVAGLDLAYEELEGIDFGESDSSSETTEENVESEYTFISKNEHSVEKKEEFNLSKEMLEEIQIACLEQDINLKPEQVVADVLESLEEIVAQSVNQEIEDDKVIAFNDSVSEKRQVGEYSDDHFENETPADESLMVSVTSIDVESPFSIAKELTTNKEYEEFAKATGYPTPKHWLEEGVGDDQINQPVMNVTLEDAKAFALWRGKRLPTQKELEAAHKLGVIRDDIAIEEWTVDDEAAEGGDSSALKGFRVAKDID